MKIDDKMAALMIEVQNDLLDKVAARVRAAGLTSEEFLSLMVHHGAMNIANVAIVGVKPAKRDKFLETVMAEIKDYIHNRPTLRMPDMN